MKGDFSRLTFDPAKQYSRVMMQQGCVQLDADWNERDDIFLHYLRTLAADLIGPYGGPSGAVGFEIDLDRTSSGVPYLKIGKGRYYVDGLLCENLNDDVRYFGGAHRKLDSNEEENPFAPPLLVYLDVWERHITPLVDESIREVALGASCTATRAQVVWQVRVTNELPGDEPTEENWKEWVDRQQPSNRGRLKARARPGGDPSDPCLASPEARYRGVENQLYRVEIQWQERGPNGTTVLGLKWSRENGSVVFPVRDLSGRTVHLDSLGRDDASGLNPGDWVEFVNDESELSGPGPLLKVEEIDASRRAVKLAAVDDRGDRDLPPTAGSHALLRRWDHRASPKTAQAGPQPLGTVLYRLGVHDWVDLEDGIQVEFEPGSYRPGDYWLIPARTATGDVTWPGMAGKPESLPPHGVQHHYAPLAFASAGDEGTDWLDLRKSFTPLAQ